MLVKKRVEDVKMNWKEFFKPDWRKIAVLVIIVFLGLFDWINILNDCESPFFGQCADYPFKHHPSLTPGLFLPFIFDEGCIEPNQKINNIISWECRPNIWKLEMERGTYCEANCNVNYLSYVYTGIYWYLLSCLIVWIYNKVKVKKK
jgi:hypothetical protein